MKILVISDTHGELGKVYQVYRSLDNIDLICHLGDFISDAQDLDKRLDVPIVAVKGNMDGALKKEDSQEIVETEAGNILLTHGHTDGVNFGYDRLVYRAKELGCNAAFFGHTHIPFLEETKEFTLLNPGSLTRPKDGTDGSFAIVEATKDGYKCEIVYFKKPFHAKGGYIKGLINYSDRF